MMNDEKQPKYVTEEMFLSMLWDAKSLNGTATHRSWLAVKICAACVAINILTFIAVLVCAYLK